MKTKEQVEKEFDKFAKDFSLGVSVSGGEEYNNYLSEIGDYEKIKSFIHQLRQNDIDSLIEWVEKQYKLPELEPVDIHDSGKLVGYNQAITDILTHLKSIN
jgi:hypothetical protein